MYRAKLLDRRAIPLTTGDVLAATEPMEEFYEDAVAIIREFMEDAWQSRFRQIARHPPTEGR
jgi:hypothetical protein